MIHFITYKQANRDESFSGEADLQRIAPAYTKTDMSKNPENDFKILKDYIDQYKSIKLNLHAYIRTVDIGERATKGAQAYSKLVFRFD